MLARKPQKRNGGSEEGRRTFRSIANNNTLIRQQLWHFFSISCSRFTHSLVPFSANFDSSMDSSAVIRSSHYPTGFMSHMQSSLQKPAVIPIQNVRWNSQSRPFIQSLAISDKGIDSHNKRNRTLVSCAKTAEAIDTTKSEASLDSFPKESLEKKPLQTATFPNGFEALVLEVCDETQIAELKVKVGEFEMHMKRNIGVAKAPMSNISPTTPPPIPSKPMVESAPSAPPPSPPKSSPEKTNPFANVSHETSPKLAALEASGTKNYVLVASPTVGSFRRGRTVKGKKQPPICKEGDIIKEGQVIGYLDQFGTSLPVKSDVTGEVLKLLFQDGEAVGYGDPLMAVLPSFHNIKGRKQGKGNFKSTIYDGKRMAALISGFACLLASVCAPNMCSTC